MNKTLIKGMLPAVVALGLTGCSAEDSSLGSNTGSIAPEVALDTEVAASARSARSETELTAEDLKELANQFKAEYKNKIGEDFPTDPVEQLMGASWPWMDRDSIPWPSRS